VKEETVDDAVAAVSALLQHGQGIVDPSRLYVLGHSLSGYLSPQIAKACTSAGINMAGFILLAGAARPLEDMILEQMTYLASLHPALIGPTAEDLKKACARYKNGEFAEGEQLYGMSREYLDDLKTYDPPREGREHFGKARVLLLFGGNDYQVTTADADLWEAGLRDLIGNTVTKRTYENVNHCFIKNKEGDAKKATPEEYTEPGHVAIEVIDELIAWLHHK